MMDGQMHPGIPGQLTMGQGQVLPNQRPQDQSSSLLGMQVQTQRQMTPLQMKSHTGVTYGQRENLTYCALRPVEYMQRLHPDQPCHPVGPSYYGQPTFHSQQVNQPVPHPSPPSGQHQSVYFRPSHCVGMVYPKMQGSSHGLGEYRLRMEQMPMYSPGRHGSNPSFYINPVVGDQFGSPTDVSSLEGKRFSSPNHRYGPSHGYRGPHIPQYQPYMVTAKSNNMVWHPVNHSVQRSIDQPQQQLKQLGLPVNIGEAGFPRRHAAMHLSILNAAGQPVDQNYIPGKRLEHFSPVMPSCGSLTMSPSRPIAECMDEFSGMTGQPIGHGSTEFSSHQYPLYGPKLSPGSQFRQGTPLHGVDVSDMHQGAYTSHAYGAQTFDDAFHPRCQNPNTPRLHSPNFCQYINSKCEPDVVAQCYGQEPSVSVGSAAVSSVAQSHVCREMSERMSNSSEMDRHLISAPMVTCCSSAPALVTLSSNAVGITSSVSTSALDGTACTISSQPNFVIKSCDANELNRQIVFDRALTSGCSMPSLGFGSSGNSLFTAVSRTDIEHPMEYSNCRDNALTLASSDVGKSAVTDVCMPELTLPSQSILSATAVSAASSNVVVTQMASTSTTYAITTSTAVLVSKQCALTTAAANLPMTTKDVLAASLSFESLHSNFLTNAGQEQNLVTEHVKIRNSLPSEYPSSLTSLQMMTRPSSEVNAELTMDQSHRKPVRTNRKKVKLKEIPKDPSVPTVLKIPKTEAHLTSIKLEERSDTIYNRPCTNSKTVKQILNPLTKELCLDASTVKNHDMPIFKTPCIVTPIPCLQKVDVSDVKDSPGKRPVTVPFGWKRKLNEDRVVYLSPSAVELDSLDQIRCYLLNEGTCKCGLQCPLIIDQVFVFDPDVKSRHLCVNDVRCDVDMTNLCNHKRKIVAMATFQHSTGLQMNLMDGMQFQASESAAVPSLGFESKSEFGSVYLSEPFPEKLSYPSGGLLVATSQKSQPGCPSRNAGAFVRPSLERCNGLLNVDDRIYDFAGDGKWSSLMNSSGVVEDAGSGPMMEALISSSYSMGNYRRPPDIGGQEEQSLEIPVSSPNAVSLSPGSFAVEAPGYRMSMHNSGSVVAGLLPHVGQQRGPSIYSPSRPLWPPFEENRFSAPYYSRPGHFGMQLQSKLCAGDHMWPYRQPITANRFGINAVQSYGNYGAALDEQTEILGVRAYDMDTQGAIGSIEQWSPSKYAAGGSKSVRKVRKKVSKKEKPYSCILEKSMPCPNIDVRQIIQEQQDRIQGETMSSSGNQPYSTNSGDNLTTFLAQQTVLVNRTLPGCIGCTSPVEDGDVTQSGSTVCGSTDDIASDPALSHSSPVVEKAFGMLSSATCLGDKKIHDYTLKRAGSASEMSVYSACHSTSSAVSQLTVPPKMCQIGANHPSIEADVHEKSAAGSGLNFTVQNMSKPMANSCMISNADCGQSCLNPSLVVSKVFTSVGQFESDIPRYQVPEKVTSASFIEPISQNNGFTGPGPFSHQLPQYPHHSNHLYDDIAPVWLHSNPMHSKNQLYFHSGVQKNAASFVVSSSGGICSNIFINQQVLSSSARSDQLNVVPSNSAGDVEVDNCSIFRPVLLACPLGGNRSSQTFANFPEADGSSGGVLSHPCTADSRKSYLYGQPNSVCTSVVESPITLVQNMVSGLVTTQNSLAMATSMIVNQSETYRRRKYSSCSDPNRGIFSQSVSSAANVLGPEAADEVGVRTVTSSGCLEMLSSTCIDCLTAGSVSSSVDTGLQVNMSASDASSFDHFTLAKQPVSIAANTAVTNVTQVIPTAGVQPSFGHPLHIPPIVQVLNPLNIGLPGTSILLSDQVLAIGSQDSAHLKQGLTMPGVRQLRIAHHPTQGQMVVFPTGQGTTVVAIQPSQSALVQEFPVEESSHVDDSGQAEEEEVGETEEGDEMEQSEADDMMRTTGTQTSTPASSFSNCNSLDSGENELDNSEVFCPDQSVSSSTREDDGITVKDSCSKRATRKAAQPTMSSILQQGQLSTAQVVIMPSVPQQPFVLPQGVTFAGALGGQGYLQLQQPVDFGFNANQVGLIHFGQITAAGGLIPTQTLVGAMSVAGGGIVSTLAPENSGALQNLSSKPDPGLQPALGAAEILHLMSPNVPQGHILVQNMPAFAPFAGAILPVVPQAALGTAICNFGGTQTIFALSQGSLGIMTSVGTSAVQQMPSSDRMFSDAMPEAPDSTVDSEDAISSNVVEAESIITSTDASQTTVASAELCTYREQAVVSASGNRVRPTIDLDSSRVEESHKTAMNISESLKNSPEFVGGKSTSMSTQLKYPDDGMRNEDTLPFNQEKNSHIHPSPSYSLSVEMSNNSAPVKLVRRRKKKKLKLQNRRRHIRTFVGPSSNFVTQMAELPLKNDTFESGQETEETTVDANLKICSPPVESVSSIRTVDESNDFLVDVSKSQEESAEASSASTRMECHVTTSVSCDHSDFSICHTRRRPRTSRLNTKIERTRTEQLNFSKCCSAVKRSLEEEVNKDDRTQDADDADSTTSLPSISYPRLFNMGDLVWGPARGFPSWPGKLVPETEVRGNPKTENGKIWVKWFGDHTFTQAEPEQLKTLSEGLETHHNARKKHRKGRRMNAKLEAAIQEAMVELDRQMVEQSKQKPGTSSLPDKTTPVRHWGSRRTRK